MGERITDAGGRAVWERRKPGTAVCCIGLTGMGEQTVDSAAFWLRGSVKYEGMGLIGSRGVQPRVPRSRAHRLHPPVTRALRCVLICTLSQRNKIPDGSDPQNGKYRFRLETFLRPQIKLIYDRVHFSAKIPGGQNDLVPLRLRYDGFTIVVKFRRKDLI